MSNQREIISETANGNGEPFPRAKRNYVMGNAQRKSWVGNCDVDGQLSMTMRRGRTERERVYIFCLAAHFLSFQTINNHISHTNPRPSTYHLQLRNSSSSSSTRTYQTQRWVPSYHVSRAFSALSVPASWQLLTALELFFKLSLVLLSASSTLSSPASPAVAQDVGLIDIEQQHLLSRALFYGRGARQIHAGGRKGMVSGWEMSYAGWCGGYDVSFF